MCDLKVGDKVQVIGPFGASFLMPNHPKSHIVMICTGTGSAPMRAMTEWRRRLRKSGKFEGGKLMLFFGARTQQELPYFGPLQTLPKDFIDINLAFSRTPGQPKRYVQDLMRERAADLAALLKDGNSHFYVCGLKSMEEGVVLALRDVAKEAGLDWETVGASAQARRPAAPRDLLMARADEVRRVPRGPGHRGRALPRDRGRVLQFAKAYDPQWFHTDPEAAAEGPFGGLIASGWHTGAHRDAAGHRCGAGRLRILRLARACVPEVAQPGAARRRAAARGRGDRGAALGEAADAGHPALALAAVQSAGAAGAGSGGDQPVQAQA